MALTLISRTARRVGIACTATDTSYFYPNEGYRALQGSHPARIRPPRGVWTVTVEGESINAVDAVVGQSTIKDVTMPLRFTHFYTGAQDILIRTTRQGATCTVVLEEAPPPA